MSQKSFKNDDSKDSHTSSELIKSQVIRLFNEVIKNREIKYEVTGQETSLLEIDLIDSILLIEVIFKLEDQFSLNSNLHKFDPNNFKNVDLIVNLILKRNCDDKT